MGEPGIGLAEFACLLTILVVYVCYNEWDKRRITIAHNSQADALETLRMGFEGHALEQDAHRASSVKRKREFGARHNDTEVKRGIRMYYHARTPQ